MGETPSSAALVGRDAIDNVVLMEDHDRAYHAWKQARLSGRILLHIDAHIDWAWIGDKDPRVLLEARTSRQVESMLEARGLWNQIGRASCRERREMWGEAGELNKKE